MPKRPCARPGCPALVTKGYCDGCKVTQHHDARRESAAKRGYDRRWQGYSRRRLRAHPVCEGLRLQPGGEVVINTHPGRVVLATLTDHILPHKGDRELFWAAWNHQSGCDACHNTKTAKEDGGFGRDHGRVAANQGV